MPLICTQKWLQGSFWLRVFYYNTNNIFLEAWLREFGQRRAGKARALSLWYLEEDEKTQQKGWGQSWWAGRKPGKGQTPEATCKRT